jgi:hypothetical protein
MNSQQEAGMNETVGRIEQLTHTPGPWTVDLLRSDRSRVIRIQDGNGNDIAQTTNGYPREVAEPNARLIAAAPELLAAARALLAIYDEHLGGLGLAGVRQARAAIAKAEGRAVND